MRQADLRIVPVDKTNLAAYDRLIQDYECEFSRLTGKVPDEKGLFPLDTTLDEHHRGFIGLSGATPFGFNVIHLKGGRSFEVSEFFIVPIFRRRGLGFFLSSQVFDRHPGSWEVKQIEGADHASSFWRRVIHRYTGGNFYEDLFDDSYWGRVTRQRFDNHIPQEAMGG